MNKSMQFKSPAWLSFVLSFMLTCGVGGVAVADDTEVFFPDVNTTTLGTVRPNILFIMDTSGSMRSLDGGNLSRLDRVKDALTRILDEMSQNTNVGLMRLSDDEGGPVLFPVSHIEADAEAIEASCSVSGGAGGDLVVSTFAGGGADSALEISVNGLTTVNPATLEVGTIGGSTGSVTEQTFRGRSISNRRRSYDDAQERSDNSRFTRTESRLDFGRRDAGLRFPGIPIPQGAVIRSARLEVVITRRRSNTTRVEIQAHDVDDSPDFDDLRDVVSRPRTTAVSPEWLVPTTNRNTESVVSPDFANVIQEIVDRPGWQEGNALSLIIPGSGRREVLNNTSGNNRPKLIIEYETVAQAASEQKVGLRFADIFIPQGTTIKNAFIDFQPSTVRVDPASFIIQGEATDNSAVFTTGLNVLSDRTPTAASVAWPETQVGAWDDPVIPPLVAGSLERSPDVGSIINEIVNRSDWCGGNALTLFIKPDPTNTGGREFHSGLLDSELAPELHITYDSASAGSGCNQNLSISQIAEGNDDAEERLGNGSVSLGSSDLELGFDGSNRQLVGMRFTNVQAPNTNDGGEIIEADISFTSKGTSFGSSTITFTVENVDDAQPFGSGDDHLSNRYNNRAPGSVTWTVPTFDADDELHTSPELQSLLQTIISRPGWNNGNAIVIFAEGSGTRRVWSVDGSNAKAPRLRVKSKGEITGKTVRQRLKEVVAGLSATGFTPVVEVLTEAAYYYRGDNVYFGRTRGSGRALFDGDNGDGTGGNNDDLVNARNMRISHCSSYTGGTQQDPTGCTASNPSSSSCERQYISGAPEYVTPITSECQSNNIVLLTDGLPNNNGNASLVRTLTGGGCNRDDCGPALAGFLSKIDQSPTLDGDQTVNTYTIGFADFASRSYLEDIAAEGNGTFSPATDAEDLADRFREIIAEILDKNTTFVAPAVTINAFNRLTHLDQLYFALFRPEVEQHWNGNLKRFRLQGGENAGIVDAKGDPAVDPNTGFFFEDVFSFWTDQSGEPDGGFVTKGGAAEQLPLPALRNKMFTNVVGNNLSAPGNALSSTNTNLTDAHFGLDNPLPGTRDLVINWARGMDVDDNDADGDRTDPRNALGDPLHSEPVLVTYGGSEATPDITVFMGTNEGFIHAFDGESGKEHFAFIPEELLPNLATLRENRGSWRSRPYGMDGPLVAVVERTAGAVNKVVVVAGMRRGGRSYYALDATDRNSPTLAWSIKGGTTNGFNELGQTWSAPVAGKVNFGGTETDVLVFGGGYDTNQDAPQSVQRQDNVGRAVFMVRASDGKLLWWAGHSDHGPDLVMNDMQASVPATPGVVDLDEDGLFDRIYIADTNAKIFRFDVDPENNGATDFARGDLFADLGGATAAENRRFYNAPDVAFIQPGEVDPFLTISIGSGFRAHPLETGVQDRFYVLRDPDLLPGQRAFFDAGPIDDPDTQLFDATDVDVDRYNEVRGAFIDMRASEKVLTVSRTFDNTILFATFQPGAQSTNACAAGEGISRLFVLDVVTLGAAVDLNESGGELTKGDRDKELQLGGVPPNPVILFPDTGETPIKPLTCIGPECVNLGFQVTTTKTFWQELDPNPTPEPSPAP